MDQLIEISDESVQSECDADGVLDSAFLSKYERSFLLKSWIEGVRPEAEARSCILGCQRSQDFSLPENFLDSFLCN